MNVIVKTGQAQGIAPTKNETNTPVGASLVGARSMDFTPTENIKNNCKQIAEKKYSDMVSNILTNRYFKL